ncbi:hypothetical protein BU15DRAFT_63612 [Melanogaster broomeanus]|nr:hypothetical protein BU15DRAFT_63612 [Melanogaster broomeanus]
MPITAGYHKIKTTSGKYLTLLSAGGCLTAESSTGATNQTWDVQPAGSSTYTIRNTGYDTSTYAYSAGQSASPVYGSTSSVEWIIINRNGSNIFLPASDDALAWTVEENNGNSRQHFIIDDMFVNMKIMFCDNRGDMSIKVTAWASSCEWWLCWFRDRLFHEQYQEHEKLTHFLRNDSQHRDDSVERHAGICG